MTRRYEAFWGGLLCFVAACGSDPVEAVPTSTDGGIDAASDQDAGGLARPDVADGGIEARHEASGEGAADVDSEDGEVDTGGGYDGGDASDEPDGSAVANAMGCLPAAEEQLLIDITGTPGLHVANPRDIRCFSRFLTATPGEDGSAGEEAMFDLIWNNPDLSLAAVVRTYRVAPGQTGTFTPVAIQLVRNGTDAWQSNGRGCTITIAYNSKIGEERGPATVVHEYFKVVGSMTCATGWAAPDKPTDEMTQFRFATRVTLSRIM